MNKTHGYLFQTFLFVLVLSFVKDSTCRTTGSCGFDRGLCNYEHNSGNQNFKWIKVESSGEDKSFLRVNTTGAYTNDSAQIWSPLMPVKKGSCVTFKFRFTKLIVEKLSDNTTNSTLKPDLSVQDGEVNFQVIAEDSNEEVTFQGVVLNFNSLKDNLSEVNSRSQIEGDWKQVEMSLSPSTYRIKFHVNYLQESTADVITYIIDMDQVKVSETVCKDNHPRFLLLTDKSANEGSEAIITCPLFVDESQRLADDDVILQRAGDDGNVTRFSHFQTKVHDANNVLYKFKVEQSLKEADEGWYRCVYSKKPTDALSPDHTQDTHEVAVSNPIFFTVYKLPTPVNKPTVSDVSSHYIKIDCNDQLIEGEGPVISRELVYYPVENHVYDQIHRIPEDSVLEIFHLQPDTGYHFQVSLRRPGAGGVSRGPPTTVRTSCAPSSYRVSDVTINSTSHQELLVNWENYDYSQINCHTYYYQVKYQQRQSRDQDYSSQDYKLLKVGQSSTALISNLEAYTSYEIIVSIVNNAGTVESKKFYGLTKESVPGPVRSFLYSSVTETTIQLEWQKPLKPNGVLRNYQISYQAISTHDPSFDVAMESAHIQRLFPDTSVLLQQLKPGTTFDVSVCAETSVGCGSYRNLTVTTDIAPPTMPDFQPPVNESHVTDTTVEVVLLPATPHGAPVTNYYVIVEEIKPDQASGRKKRTVEESRASPAGNNTVIIPESPSPSVECNEEPILDYETAKKNNGTKFAVAKLNPSDLEKETPFVIGDGKNINGYTNHALDPNKKYKITFVAVSEVDGIQKKSCQLLYTKEKADPPEEPEDEVLKTATVDDEGKLILYASIGGCLLALIIFTVICIVFFRINRRKSKQQKDRDADNPFEMRLMLTDVRRSQEDRIQSSQYSGNSYNEEGTLMLQEYKDDIDGEPTKGDFQAGVTSQEEEKFAIRVDDFHLHVQQMKQQDYFGFREEFLLLPDGQKFPCTVAQHTVNRRRNRYTNVMAYDHSRVVLRHNREDITSSAEDQVFFGNKRSTSSDNSQSDYINASYLQGYKTPQTYIATQAPTEDTANDMWQMIWQEKCSVVIMLCNIMEVGKMKCYKYWPDITSQGDECHYGHLEVCCTCEEKTADYVVRTFVVREQGKFNVREVRQFHFLQWPDHGLPSRPTNILTFISTVKSFEPNDGATVVHCSAGSGRSGCYVTIDMALQMAREEEVVDVYNTVKQLRKSRMDMVQTEEQYIFIHESVLEALICGETSVTPDQLALHYDEIISLDDVTGLAPIQDEFETLNLITPRLQDEDCSISRLPRNRNCNRFNDVLPNDRYLAHLNTPDPSNDRSNSYINAVFVDSYKRRNAFIVTQMPLQSTVIDIWRLIWDHDVQNIVVMNHHTEHDHTCAVYWPEEGSAIYSNLFRVEPVDKRDELEIVIRTFKLTLVTSQESRYVRQTQLLNWEASAPVPYNRNALLRIVQLNMKQGGDNGKTLVHCVAGAGRSGTYVACHNLCEQIADGNYHCDVFNVVQRLRNIRPHLVETLEQYRFCYEVAIEFADQM